MKMNETRKKLIDGTIHVIAREGLEKATTKNISLQTGINETYIYRCFEDKDDLYVKCFAVLDQELITTMMDNMYIMRTSFLTMREKWRIYFNNIWRFLLSNEDNCRCYIRYYYSTYFKRYSYMDHMRSYKVVVEKMSTVFKPTANVWMLLNYALSVMLSFSIKVYDGELKDDENTEEHVFRVAYGAIRQYFIGEEPV